MTFNKPRLRKENLLYISLAFIINISAQSLDFDEDFLDSLDPSIRSELESSSDEKEERELEKLFKSDASIEKNKAILEKIKKQITELDTRLIEIIRQTAMI